MAKKAKNQSRRKETKGDFPSPLARQGRPGQGQGEIRRRHADLQMHNRSGHREHCSANRPQPRLRLHQVLEAGRRHLLRRRRRARDNVKVTANGTS